MSGTHRYYTVTGRALPLPPRRTPSRHSTILRLPTRRAEEERSTTVRADSPGRIEVPGGGEFHNIPDSQRAASQMVVYDVATAAAAVKREKQSAAKAADTAAASAYTSKASSVARRGLHNGTSSAPVAATAAAARSATVAAAAAAAAAPRASPPQSVKGDTSSRLDTTPLQQTPARHVVRAAHNRGSVRTSPLPPSTVFTADSGSASETSSPCLNRLLGREESREDMTADWQRDQQQQRDDGVSVVSDVQSIPMSSARQSHAPADRRGPRPTAQGVREKNRVVGEALQQQQQQPAPAAVSPVAQRSVSATTADSRSRLARFAALPTTGDRSVSGVVHTAPVERHDHTYSQRKLDERRAGRPADVSTDTSYRPAAGSQQLALVPAPAMVRYSTRSPLSDDDPLEMNTPIAHRVRQHSMGASASRVQSHAAPSSAAVVGTLEGTELMPSLPRLQGRKASAHHDAEDRTYCTIVRFIEYQPEAERPALEAMLNEFSGREDELCGLLTETYGEDFAMLKAACGRGSAVPLLADHTACALLLTDAPPHPNAQQPAQPSVRSGGRSDGAYSQGAAGENEDVYDRADELQAWDGPPAAEDESEEDAQDGYEEYLESSRPYSTPRVEEGDYDEEPVYDGESYARELLTPAVPYERR